MPPDDLVGRVLGSYQIEARIEQGGQGPVYRAVQTAMGRLVRLYTLDRKLAQDSAQIERFMSDASVKANVRHPYIFAVYEAGESDGVYFYSCEYVPSRSLQWSREQGIFLDERTALQAMKVAAEVLAYFSRENIAHKVLSGESVLLGPSNRPRIANIAARDVAYLRGRLLGRHAAWVAALRDGARLRGRLRAHREVAFARPLFSSPTGDEA